MIGLLLLSLKNREYWKKRIRVITLLLLAYGAVCFIFYFNFTQKQVYNRSDNSSWVSATERSNHHFPVPLTSERHPGPAENESLEDDENFVELTPISSFISIDRGEIRHLNTSLLPGSLNLLFSPPKIRHF